MCAVARQRGSPAFDVLEVAGVGTGDDRGRRFTDRPFVFHLRDDQYSALALFLYVDHGVGGAEPGQVAHAGIRG